MEKGTDLKEGARVAPKGQGTKSMGSSGQIKLGAMISYLSIGINMALGLIYTPWMIHSIGRENYGLYTLAGSVISLFVFDFGLSQAVQRFIAKYLAEGKIRQANNCLGLVARLYLWIDVILLIVLTAVFFLIPSIYRELTAEEIGKFKVVYCIAAAFSVISFPFIPLNGVLSANEKFVQLKSCELIHKFLKVGLMSACLVLGYGLYALVAVNAVSGALTILLKLLAIKRETGIRVNYRYKDPHEFKALLSFSFWVTVIALAQRMIFNIAPTILGMFSGSASIAVLGIAITLEGYVFTFASAISGLFLPKVAREIASGESVLPLMVKVGRIQIMVIALIIFGFICVGEDFIGNWVGDSFSAAYWGAILLFLPSLFHLPQDIADQALILENRMRQKAMAYVLMAIINITLMLLLAPGYGMTGICISVCVSFFARTIALDIIYQRELRLNVVAFFKASFIRMSPPLLLTLAIGMALHPLIPWNGWGGLLLQGALFTAEYGVIMYNMAMTSEERRLFSAPIARLYQTLSKMARS